MNVPLPWLNNVKLNGDFFPPFMRKMIEEKKKVYNKKMGWKERTHLIIFLKERGISIKDTISFLKNNLKQEEFFHCVWQERQPFYIYERDTADMSKRCFVFESSLIIKSNLLIFITLFYQFVTIIFLLDMLPIFIYINQIKKIRFIFL